MNINRQDNKLKINSNEQRNCQLREKRNLFFKTINTKDFIDWQKEVLSKIYYDIPMVDLYGKKHMAFTIKTNLKNIFNEEKEKSNFGKLLSTDTPQIFLNDIQKEYKNIMKKNINNPKSKGFELKDFILNDENELIDFTANTCTYMDNVLTSHILEYEMYQLYKSNFKIYHKTRDTILKKLKIRNQIHKNINNLEVLLTGRNRHSLMSVQMIVIYKCKISNLYKTIIYKRSDKVALKPNYLQIVPAGGFEVFEEDQSNPSTVRNNFDIKFSLYREFLEELFLGRDFEAKEIKNNSKNNSKNIVYDNPIILALEKLLDNKEAKLEFLGNVTDLTTLRPELSFLLLVNDVKFFDNIQMNFEGSNQYRVRVDELDKMFKDSHKLYPSSAGLIDLAEDSSIFKTCVSYNQN